MTVDSQGDSVIFHARDVFHQVCITQRKKNSIDLENLGHETTSVYKLKKNYFYPYLVPKVVYGDTKTIARRHNIEVGEKK